MYIYQDIIFYDFKFLLIPNNYYNEIYNNYYYNIIDYNEKYVIFNKLIKYI